MLKVKGFHRPGDSQVVYSDYQQGIDNASAELYVNDKAIILNNQASGAQATQLIDNDNDWRPVSYGDVTMYVPNSMYGTRIAFDAGLYENELPFTVTDGTITLGIRLNESVECGWVIFDDFRLEYLGTKVTDISKLDNAIYIEPVEGIRGGTIDLAVKLKNNVTPVGFSFMLTLPEGFTLTTVGNSSFELSDRTKKMNLTQKDWNNGTYDFALIPSSNSSTISGSDGTIVTFHLAVPNSVQAGQNYSIMLTKNLIQTQEGNLLQDRQLANVLTTFTVIDYIPGDVNNDGKVTPSDAIMILYHYFGVEQTGFNTKAADLNGDGNISPADAISALYLYFGSSTAVRATDFTPEPQ